ncbi:MAG: hypothetical protein CME26_02865 [Gemmatimonadetes bacterium]|nr:hypothetical protein [Gemmatimonadota bacterium]
MGVEAQLIPFDELGPVHDNQVVIGEVLGIYRGFWANAGEGELGTHSIDGLFLPGAPLLDSEGQIVPMGLLDNGVGGSGTGAIVSGQLFIESMTIEGVATPFSLTTRIRDFDPTRVKIVSVTSGLDPLLTTGDEPVIVSESTPGRLQLTDYGSDRHGEGTFVTVIARSVATPWSGTAGMRSDAPLRAVCISSGC